MSRTSRRFAGQPTRQENWRSLAACRSADPDLFFPISSSGRSIAQVAQAKAICAGCQVRRDCLAFALRTYQAHGVWGGLSEQERYPLWSAVLAGVERGQAAEIDAVIPRICAMTMSMAEQVRQRHRAHVSDLPGQSPAYRCSRHGSP